MKLDIHTRWLRLLIEFLPASPAIRRYRALPSRFDSQMGRLLQRQITRQMRRPTSEEAS
ncbi:MAG: hypothetical protein IH623_09145 [Verrucomicrobia bacterium]|nr:hypothetical protein [Verrucomicrobiota bacterium]